MSKNNPAVSVIIPTYNRAHLLGRAIQSVLDQTYQDFELIVIDDGSTDNTEEIVGSFNDERIRYIKHDKNRGGAAARNTGIKAARGKYIAFQDSDDEWLPEKLEKQMSVFEDASPMVGIVYSDMWRITRNNKKYWHSPTVVSGNLVNPRTSDYQVANIGIQSTLIKRECLSRVGLFDEEFPRLIDLEFLIRLSKCYRFEKIEEPLVKYYVMKGISSDKNALVVALKLLLEKYSAEVKEDRKFLANQYFGMGIALCLVGEIKQGRSYLIKAIRIYPPSFKFRRSALASLLLGQNVYNGAAASYRKIRGWFSKGQ